MSIDGYSYYVIFVNYFKNTYGCTYQKKKKLWLYPLHLKTNIYSIFHQFKSVVKNYFKTSIVSIYSNGGGMLHLKTFLLALEFSTFRPCHTLPNIMVQPNSITNISLKQALPYCTMHPSLINIGPMSFILQSTL